MNHIYENEEYQKDLAETVENTPFLEKLEGKNILITGGTGLVGSGIVDTLVYYNEHKAVSVKRQIRLWVLSRNERTAKNRFSHVLKKSYFHYISQDIKEPITILDPISYIIHAAGKGDPGSMTRDPVGIIDANILGTKQVLEFARHQEECHVTFLSSGEVYGIMYHMDEEGIRETDNGKLDQLSGRNCYGISKRAGENLCISYKEEYDINVTIARLAHVYGATAMDGESRVIFQFLQKALAGEDIVMKSRGNQVRSWTYLSDVVCGILTVLLMGENGQAYNVSNMSAACSIKELAETIAIATDVLVVTEIADEKEQKGDSGIVNAVLNDEKLRSLGCCMQVNVVEGIKRIQRIYGE